MDDYRGNIPSYCREGIGTQNLAGDIDLCPVESGSCPGCDESGGRGDDKEQEENALTKGQAMWNIEWEQETDGRWIAEIPDISGVMAYGTTKDEALRNVEILALKILTERLERGEEVQGIHDLFHTV